MPEDTAENEPEIPSAADIATEIRNHTNRLRELKKQITFATDADKKLALALRFAEESAETIMPLMADLAMAFAETVEDVDSLETEVFGLKIGPAEQEVVADAIAEALENLAISPQLKEKLESALEIIAPDDDDDEEGDGEEGPAN